MFSGQLETLFLKNFSGGQEGNWGGGGKGKGRGEERGKGGEGGDRDGNFRGALLIFNSNPVTIRPK